MFFKTRATSGDTAILSYIWVQRYNKNCIYASVRAFFLKKKRFIAFYQDIGRLLGACSRIVVLYPDKEGH